MIIGSKNDISVKITAFLIFVILLIGSVYYYQERMMFCDEAYIFFETLNHKSFQIPGSRFGAFVTHMFPLFSGLTDMPFKASLILYSISFNLFYLTVAAILLFRFKNTKLGILFALYFVLFVSDTYFWTINEVHQAMGWCSLLFGIIHNQKRQQSTRPIIHFSTVLVLAFLSLFTHPLMLFIFPFLWLFTILEKELNPYSKKQIILLSLAFIVIAGIKYYIMKGNGYDADKIHGATHFSLSDIWKAFSSPMSKAISEKLIKEYFFVPVLFCLGLIAAIIKKKYKQIALVLFFAIPYYLAVCLTYNVFLTFYIESEWMPFSIITTILFVYYFVPMVDVKWTSISLLFIFAVRIGFILQSAKKFETRSNWTFSTVKKMKQQGITKGYIYITDSLRNMLLIEWACPMESLIASKLMGEVPQRTFIVDTKEAIQQKLIPEKNILIAPYKWIEWKDLNAHYFVIDTTQQYRLIQP